MATQKSQRIGIWIITIVMILGTLGSFVAMGLMMHNETIDTAQTQKLQEEYAAKQQAASEALSGYSTRTFDANSAKELKTETLVEGTGDVVKATDSINASYFGWTSDGKIFDSSKKKDMADTPATFSLSGVIKGWTEGLTGVKVGSVVRLTIPSDKAYGSSGSGSLIAPNSPLEFIVEVHKVEAAKS